MSASVMDEGSAAEEKVVGRSVLLHLHIVRSRVHNAQVQLLPQPLPLQLLRPDVPQPRVVQLHHHRRPCVAVHLPIKCTLSSLSPFTSPGQTRHPKRSPFNTVYVVPEWWCEQLHPRGCSCAVLLDSNAPAPF
jgi:hypothetical protein